MAGSRKVFAAGAVRAALWTQDRPAGLYSMKNVLGFEG
jgi:4-hydroxy-tetrahydrodipicolinate reductase